MAEIVEPSVDRHAHWLAVIVRSVIATVAFPAMPGEIQARIRRHLYRIATVYRPAVPLIAFPSVAGVIKTRVSRNPDRCASVAFPVKPTQALPSSSREIELCILGYAYCLAVLSALTEAALAFPTIPRGIGFGSFR